MSGLVLCIALRFGCYKYLTMPPKRNLGSFLGMIMTIWRTAVFYALIAFACSAAHAANLYEVVVPVQNQDKTSLQKAAKLGLERVLIRASGEQNVADNYTISQTLKRAEQYVSQYAYGDDFDLPTVKLSFSRDQVLNLLRKASLPVWSDERPGLVLWLVVDTPEGKQFVDQESFPELTKALGYEASRRGLSLVFPLYDLRDSTAMSIENVWNLDTFPAQQASQRYDSQSVLMGRLSPLSGGVWVSEWAYIQEGEVTRLDARDSDFRFLRPAINRVADTMAASYAIAPQIAGQDRGTGTIMHIAGLKGFADYADAIRYLESASGIAHANVLWMSGSDVLVNLVLRGTPEKVQGHFRLGRRMIPSPETANTFFPPEHLAVDWFYRWNGAPSS